MNITQSFFDNGDFICMFKGIPIEEIKKFKNLFVNMTKKMTELEDSGEDIKEAGFSIVRRKSQLYLE